MTKLIVKEIEPKQSYSFSCLIFPNHHGDQNETNNRYSFFVIITPHKTLSLNVQIYCILHGRLTILQYHQGATKTVSTCPRRVVLASGQVGCQSYFSFGQVNESQKVIFKKNKVF